MSDLPLLIYEQTCHATFTNPRPGPRHALRAFPRPDLRRIAVPDEPTADTAGEQDHTDPWAYAGDDADAPTDPDGGA